MPLTKKEIKEIIENEIIVDAYHDCEVYAGWATYMEDNLNFPFEAEYLVRRAKGENEWKKVEIIDNYTTSKDYNGEDDYYLSTVLEEIDMIIPVEINDLRNIKADEDTLNALQIWQYRSDYI